jgi:hypothetical protein
MARDFLQRIMRDALPGNGFSGGVTAQRMTTDTYRIVARGNTYMGATAIEDYTLLTVRRPRRPNRRVPQPWRDAPEADGVAKYGSAQSTARL